MYAVIEFSPGQGGGLAIVNSNWLTPRKKETFWPPFKENSQFQRSLKRKEPINTETWNLYNVKRIFYETDDLEKANEKVRQAGLTSDMQTEDEEDQKIKRRVKAKRVIESSDSDASTCNNKNQLPSPPKIKKKLFGDKKSATKSPSSEKRSTTTGGIIKEDTETRFDIEKLLNPACYKKDSSNYLRQIITPPRDDRGNYLDKINKSRSDTNKITPATETFDKKSANKKSEFDVLLTHILEIKATSKLTLAKVETIENRQAGSELLTELPISFPITTDEQLEEIEEFLQLSENKEKLVRYFAGIGGSSVTQATNKLLKKSFSDSLVAKFNFFGRNEKRAFKDLGLLSCIIDGVKRNNSKYTTEDIEKAIKTWLKHAPQRLKRAK